MPAPIPPKKPAAKKPDNIFQELATHLSGITGKLDKDKNIIRQAAPVMVAAGSDGQPVIRLPGVISTRCETLDAAIGVGGLPMSRITTIAGGEGGGKTTIAGQCCAEVQAMGGIPIYVDNEHKLDLDYFANLGVDLTKFLLTQPGTVEDSFNIMNETIIRVSERFPKRPILAVLDSLNASKSENEYEEDGSSDFSKSNQGGLGSAARFMSNSLPKLARAISGKPVCILMISQPRENIGQPGQNLVAGGNAPKFYSAVIIQLIRKGFWEESAKKIGSMMEAKVVKNQVSVPMKTGEFGIRWGFGIDHAKSVMDRAIQMGLLNSSSGGWYEMPTETEGKPLKWQGLKGWHKLQQEKPELAADLIAKIREPYKKMVQE